MCLVSCRSELVVNCLVLFVWYCLLVGIFHHSIPVLSQPVKNKHSLPAVFGVGFAFTTFVYVALGLVLGLYFGGANDVRECDTCVSFVISARNVVALCCDCLCVCAPCRCHK